MMLRADDGLFVSDVRVARIWRRGPTVIDEYWRQSESHLQAHRWQPVGLGDQCKSCYPGGQPRARFPSRWICRWLTDWPPS